MVAFLINIAGAAALLIWSVRLVRTGVERAFMVQLRLWLRRSSRNRVLASATGLAAAMMLQSSTAVAILVSNFAATGAITSAVGLAILLGADLGSAIVAQLLLVRQTWLIPVLLISGTGLFLRGQERRTKQTGRILIGLALIFVSLDMLRAATTPLLDSESALNILGYLGTDLFAAFLLGAIFAWLVHSSVAAVLFFLTMVSQGALPASAALAMVLGANLGGSFIAYVITLAAPAEARRMIVANLVLRGGGAALLLTAIGTFPSALNWLGSSEASQAINLHIGFNALLCLVSLPFVASISRFSALFVPDKSAVLAQHGISALDPRALDEPPRALSCASREVVRMGERIEAMLVHAGRLFDDWNDGVASQIRERDAEVRQTHRELKLYLAKLNRSELDAVTAKGATDLSLLAAALEAASNMLVRNLLDLAHRLDAEGLSFSTDGRRDIDDFYDRVLANVQLSISVMMKENPDDARELVSQKERVRSVEQALQRKHLGRLRDGQPESIETSNIHQETLRVLKQVNTSFAMAGYPILTETGDLLSSRLLAPAK